MMTPIAAVLPDVASLLTNLLVPNMQLMIWQMFFSPFLISKNYWTIYFELARTEVCLPQGYINSSALYHNLVHCNLDCLSLL